VSNDKDEMYDDHRPWDEYAAQTSGTYDPRRLEDEIQDMGQRMGLLVWEDDSDRPSYSLQNFPIGTSERRGSIRACFIPGPAPSLEYAELEGLLLLDFMNTPITKENSHTEMDRCRACGKVPPPMYVCSKTGCPKFRRF
jgi:hypothetical protein